MLKIEDIATKDYERVVVFRDDCGFFAALPSIAQSSAQRWVAVVSFHTRVNTLP